MDASAARVLNAKRSLGLNKQVAQDSPAYDASDEDASEGPATAGAPTLVPQRPIPRPKQPARSNVHAAAHLVDSDTGTDSPTYDGDIESTTTITKQPTVNNHRSLLSIASMASESSTSTSVVTPSASVTPLQIIDHHQDNPLMVPEEPSPVPSARKQFNPASLTPEDIQAFVRRAIEGEEHRSYKILHAPTDRPVRIYADGQWIMSSLPSLISLS